MAGKIPNHFIQDLLARTDIVDLIDARVPLKRSGANYMARCPFHNEKSPSFSVNRDKQFYYCFGCGARGTATGFLMDYDRLTFVEAVESLADAVGLTVPREQGGVGSEQLPVEPIYRVQEDACRFYQEQLKNHSTAGRAVDYLRNRGVSGELALQYRLGYAPPGSRNLPSSLPREALLAAGLVVNRENGHGYDWFRDRIVFPIRDRRGRIVGFGGRLLGEGTPKYLNSPETAAFSKHREVYGLYELLNATRRPDFILLVEGYMDVIALAQSGIPNAVASLGTATSSDHIGLLFRYTNEIVLCFDGDTAGYGAAWKALESSLPHLREGRQLRFLTLPEGHDPDTLVRAEGAGHFRTRIASARPFSDYFFERLADRLDLGTIEGRAALVEKAAPLIEKLPAGVFREMIGQHLDRLADRQVLPASPEPGRPVRQVRPRSGRDNPSALRTFLALLLQHPHLIDHVDTEQARRLVDQDPSDGLILKLIELLRNSPHITTGGILESFRETPEEPIIGKLVAWGEKMPSEGVDEEFLNHLGYLTGDRLKENRLEVLIHKSKSTRLTPEEREEMRRLTTLAPPVA